MPQVQDKRLNPTAIAAICFALLPIAVFYALLWHSMRNIPIMDDYHAIIEFALILKQSPTLGAKFLWLLAAQHNDYKFVLLHIFVALQWMLTGHVNFSFFIVFGNVMQLGILWLCWKHCFTGERDLSRRIVLFVPIVFLFMQLNGVENLDWAITDMEKIPAIFFSFAALHYLLKDTRNSYWLAWTCALLAYFSSANGFMIAPIGFALLMPRRKWGQLALWTLGLLLAVAIYAYKYVPFGVTATGNSVTLPAKMVFLLSLLGSAIENMSRFPVKGSAIALGVVMLALFALSLRRRYDRAQPFLFYATVWCLLTCLIIAQGRSGFGITLSLTGRYKVFSDLLMVFTYVYLVSLFDTVKISLARRKWLYATVLGASILFALGSDYFGYKFLLNRQRRVAVGINQYEADPSKNVPMVGLTDQPIPQEEPEHDRIVLTQALQSGIYKLPPIAQR